VTNLSHRRENGPRFLQQNATFPPPKSANLDSSEV
jgi:hypothetical protein